MASKQVVKKSDKIRYVVGQNNNKKNENAYKKPMKKVLKLIHPNLKLSDDAANSLNDLLEDIFKRVAKEAQELLNKTKKKTISGHEIEAAIKLMFPKELGEYAVSEGRNAVRRFETAMAETKYVSSQHFKNDETTYSASSEDEAGDEHSTNGNQSGVDLNETELNENELDEINKTMFSDEADSDTEDKGGETDDEDALSF